jgi:two-component system CheB/CheR fusion protein
VPACSTGEEAYTLAMLFLEELGDKAGSIPLQIFATDLSELVISKARLGIYCTNDVANVSDQRLEKFFTKIDGSYRINKVVRDLCVFAPHNVSKDPPFSRMDLISCCNLMIYLDTVLQKKILNIFHYALNPEGYLVLGKSETIGNAVQLFSQLEKKYKIYTRKGEGSNNAGFEMTYRIPEQEKINIENRKKVKIKENDHHADLEKAVDNLLLNKYIPATVVINHELEILQFRGSTGLYLEPSPGRASLNLIKMAKPALAFELRNAVHKANKEGQPVKRNGIEMMINEKNHLVQVEVVPLKSDTEDRLFLVIFEKVLLPSRQLNSADNSKDALVLELENELGSLKEDIHSIIEEQEASNEELQSANEEIVSSNEELQSINEELETSKEELESTNEELMTINAELQMRNEQLSEAYEYAEMVFNTISEGVLILDKDLRMRSANNRFFQIFDLKEENIEGQLFFEFENRQWDLPTMREMLDQTIPKLGQCRQVQLTHTFKGVGEKTFLINCSRLFQKVHREQITLIAFEDITQYTKKSG